jgi:ADP-ribose pyrophosphatase
VAQAELREEAGLVADDWTPLGHFAPYKGVSNERCHFFLARQLHEVPQELELSEAITVHRMPIQEARRTMLDQECGDGQSMAGLMLLDRWLQAGNQL